MFEVLATVLVLAPLDTAAQIRTDASLGKPSQALTGPAYMIPQSLGRLSGNNLFHSFSTFNVATGESATFTTGSAGIANVISRVTGGAVSQINGLLQLKAASGAPAFFFINPAGVVFGEGASIDVPGAFHASTADYIKFPDGNFYANATASSTFSAARPAAFGFLGTTRSSITINNRAALSTREVNALTLTAGDILVDNATVSAVNGDIRVAAVGTSRIEVPLTGPLPAMSGRLSIVRGGQITSSTSGPVDAGGITVGAGTIIIDGANSDADTAIATKTSGTGNAGSIEIASTGGVAIREGLIESDTFAAGNAGALAIASRGRLIVDAGVIRSGAGEGSSGRAGAVDVSVSQDIDVLDVGTINTDTRGTGDAGAVNVSGRDITLDGNGVIALIGSQSHAAGHGGKVTVRAERDLRIVDRGEISADALGDGDAGTVLVSARNITVDGYGSIARIGSGATEGSHGNAGFVGVVASGGLQVLRGGTISAQSQGTGNAGEVTVVADNITLDALSTSNVTGIRSDARGLESGDAGSIDVFTRGALRMYGGSFISSDLRGRGKAGAIRISAGSTLIDGNHDIAGVTTIAASGTSGAAGSIEFTVERDLVVRDAGLVASSTGGTGDAGIVKVTAGTIRIEGASGVHTGFSTNTAGRGRGGVVDVHAQNGLYVSNGATISSDSDVDAGPAGTVKIAAGEITIDGRGNIFTQISTTASGQGEGGKIEVSTPGTLLVRDAAVIGSLAFSSGNAGSVNISAGNVTIDGKSGNQITGIVTSNVGGTGDPGRVDVVAAGNVRLLNGGSISSDTFGLHGAGSIRVAARNIEIEDRADGQLVSVLSTNLGEGAGGSAGNIEVAATAQLRIGRNGEITSSTFGSGSAGAINVTAGDIVIDGSNQTIQTGILTIAFKGSGDAGAVGVTAKNGLTVVHGGLISSSTNTQGRAGSVNVHASEITIDGKDAPSASASRVTATALSGSSGQTGSVVVKADRSIIVSNDGLISIANGAEVADPLQITPTAITLIAPVIKLFGSGGTISAESSGNVSASNIFVRFGPLLSLDDSAIITSAQDGNGGGIRIAGTGTLLMRGSRLTTSVLGVAGNGGDIDVRARSLILDTGFIQANTVASNARGGDVTIDVSSLVPSGATAFVGGDSVFTFEPGIFGFNVIQAAAPTGVSGTITVSDPVLDLAGRLIELNGQAIDPGGLARSPCVSKRGSSFANAGRGGLAPSARGLLGADQTGADGEAEPLHVALAGTDCAR